MIFGEMAKGEAQAHSCVERQRGVSDGRDVLLAEQIVGLCVNSEPGCELDGSAEIQFGIVVVEVLGWAADVLSKLGVDAPR